MRNPNELNNGEYYFLLGSKIEAFSFALLDISSGSDNRQIIYLTNGINGIDHVASKVTRSNIS